MFNGEFTATQFLITLKYDYLFLWGKNMQDDDSFDFIVQVL